MSKKEVIDLSLVELLYYCTNKDQRIQLAALRLLELKYNPEGLEIFFKVRKYDFNNPSHVINVVHELFGKNLTQPKYQAKRTQQELQQIILECRENSPEDITLLKEIARYLSEEK